ncbi:MAG: Acetoacetate metabolism regulatory protein AtoC, partial [Spartobacteria bacterium]|nr:Acetoacetate metabolism regulatory protein AtoC [Spartobacteria bacterium]
MPPASQSPIGTTSQGSILLIEEYDALASAITSALKKFAPRHVTHVARSLAEAKTIAQKIAPSLIVIDFDPAFAGLSAFLQKMQASHPDARVLVIAGKIPREIATESRSFGALQFVGKPFDVPDFGAAVQALLGPWTESETARPRGTLLSLGLPDVLLAQSAGARTVAMEIKNDAGKSGEIHLRQGVVAHAEAGKKAGPEALREMLAWSDIEVREREKPRASRLTVDGGWMELVIEAFQIAKARQTPPPVKDVPPKPHHKTGKKIVAVDDTEMLLIFVEDVLMTA